MGDLGRRVSVAAVGIPTVLGLLYVGGWALTVPVAVLAILGARELTAIAIAGGVRPFGPPSWAVAAALVLAASWRPAPEAFAGPALLLLVVLGVLAVLGAIFRRGVDERPLAAISVTLFTAVYAGLTLATVPLLHALPARLDWAATSPDPWSGLTILSLPLAATWVGDAAAYFAGSAWGRRKLAPKISPKKSWVGLWASLLGAGAAAGIWWVFAAPRMPGLPFGLASSIALGVLLGGAAAIGDLAESLLKREAGVKDSGTLFPGHGGVLDRLDALTLTLPVTLGALLIAEALR